MAGTVETRVTSPRHLEHTVRHPLLALVLAPALLLGAASPALAVVQPAPVTATTGGTLEDGATVQRLLAAAVASEEGGRRSVLR